MIAQLGVSSDAWVSPEQSEANAAFMGAAHRMADIIAEQDARGECLPRHTRRRAEAFLKRSDYSYITRADYDIMQLKARHTDGRRPGDTNG